MELQAKVAVVTGAARGIGAALYNRFKKEGAAAVIGADIDPTPGIVKADVTLEADMEQLVQSTLATHGRIDLFCSNAGILCEGGESAPLADWDRSWHVNVMSHIIAARLVLPAMLQQGGGCLLQTVSAAGLLTMIGSAPYAVTKHAALGFAEWLAVTYGNRGIHVAALCPLGVKTDLLGHGDSSIGNWLKEGAITPEEAAEAVVRGLADERFLILPHPEVRDYFLNKATDYDRWLGGMRRVQAKVLGY